MEELNRMENASSIVYRTDIKPSAKAVAELYDDSGIKRPTQDLKRIETMLLHANLVVTAWAHTTEGETAAGETLVGIARSLTDFCYCCYLSDLAVKKSHQHQGIGIRLMEETKTAIGEQTMLLLLAAPQALEYYPKVSVGGKLFLRVDNGYVIKRAM